MAAALTYEATFANWVAGNIMTAHRDESGAWYVTHDVQWFIRTARAAGFIITMTGRTEFMPDDSFRHYFAVS